MVIITEGKMKKLFTLMAASAALAFTSCDNDEIVPAEEFATSNDVKVEIAVAPMMDGTRALKTGWETGDKINIWFDNATCTVLPQCVLTYDGANWVSSSVDASVLSASGGFFAIYESSNKMFQKTYEDGEVSVPYVELEDLTRIYDGILSCQSGYVSYTYSSEDNKLTAAISIWYLINNYQVVVSGLTEDPSNYAMEVRLLDDTDYRSSVLESISFNDIGFGTSGIPSPVRGCANTDGVAFYFMFLPEETNANYQFRLYDIKNDEWLECTKNGTVPSPSEGFYGIKLKAGDFRSLTFSLNVGENSIPEGTPKVTFTPSETGVYKLHVDYGFVDIPNNLDLERYEETEDYKYTYLEKDKKYVIQTDAEDNDVTLTVTKAYDLETFGVDVEYPSLENKKIYSFVAPETAVYTFVPVDGQGDVDIYSSVNVNLYDFGTQESDNKAILFEGNRYFIVWEKADQYPNAGLKIEKSAVGVGTIPLGTATTVTSNTPYLLEIAEEGVYYIDIDDADAWIEIKSLDKYYSDNDKIQELKPGRYQFVYYGDSYSTTNVTIKKVEPVALGEGTTTLAANTVYKITVPEKHLYKMSKYIYGIFEDADGLFYSIFDEVDVYYLIGDGNPFTFEKVTSLDATPLTLGVDNAVVGKGLYSIIIPSDGYYEFRGSGDYEYGLYIFSLDGSSNYVEHEDTRWLEAGTYYFVGLSDNSDNKVKFELE